MNLKETYELIATLKKGTHYVATWQRPVKLRKAFKNIPVVKETTMMIRFPVDYDKLESVKEKRANGELPVENQGLQGEQQWVQFPFLIHNPKNGMYHFRFNMPTLKNATTKTKVVYRIGNIEVDKSQLLDMMLASEKTSRPKNNIDAFNVNIANIVAIHEHQSKQVAKTHEETEQMTKQFEQEKTSLQDALNVYANDNPDFEIPEIPINV